MSSIINEWQFNRIINESGHRVNPNTTNYNAHWMFFDIYFFESGITNMRELAMFLAHVFHETGGLQFMRQHDGPSSREFMGRNGKNYYGRGCLQLAYDYNYLAAYEQIPLINGDTRNLHYNPDIVADYLDLAWRTAFWFWKNRVHDSVKYVSTANDADFDVSIRMLRPNEMMNPGPLQKEQANNRRILFKKFCTILNAA